VGARAAAAFGATPRALLGGGIFAERGFAGALGASIRLSGELAATGGVAVGDAGASFLRGIARVEGCAFPLRPTAWLSATPCLAVEGGVLHGKGTTGGNITHVDQADVPWAAVPLLARIALTAGGVLVEVQAGPALPLIRRKFVFGDPSSSSAVLIHDVPAVTAWLGIGVGGRIP
jgi:hypothetical protein